MIGARVSAFLSLALLFSTMGCAATLRSYDVTPIGLTRGDATLRQLLARGNADTALYRFTTRKTGPAPSDDLLRGLYKGVVAYYAGQYDSSAFLLDRAGLLMDDRESFRLSREAAAILSNDRALPYEPSRTERLMIPYYGALSYLRIGDVGEAAVEARRLSHALELLEDAPKGHERQVRGFLRYFAGTVFEAAGQHNDAAVAYRNAHKLLGDSIAGAHIPADSGDVIVVFEDGFVAHRFEESLTIVLADDERDGLRHDDRRRRDESAEAVASRAFAQALRPAFAYEEGPRLPRHHWYIGAPERERRPVAECKPKTEEKSAQTPVAKVASGSNRVPMAQKANTPPAADCERDDEDREPYILRLAWPSYHTERRPARAIEVLVGDRARDGTSYFLSVSDGVVGDFDRERTRILARTVARAAAKLAVTKSAEKSAGKKNEDLGKLIGAIANVSGAVLEQADTRSWTLLPGGITLTRLRLPVGAETLAINVSGSYGARRIDLGTVQVRGGEMSFVTARNW